MSNPQRTQSPRSPLSSTLSYAASFALPTSRSSSPAAYRGNIGGGTGRLISEIGGGGGIGGFGGGSFGVSGGARVASSGARVVAGRGGGGRKENRQSESWDDAWDSSSDTESPSTAITRPPPPKQSSSYQSYSSSRQVSSSTPISFNRPAAAVGVGVGVHGEQIAASSSSSGNVGSVGVGSGVGSWKEVSPPSPGGWEGNGQGVSRAGAVAGGNTIGKGGLSRLVSLAGSSSSGGGSRVEGGSSHDSDNQSHYQSPSPATPRRIAGFVSQSSTISTVSSSATSSSSNQTITPNPQPLQIQQPQSTDSGSINQEPSTTNTDPSTSTTNTNTTTGTPSQAGENWTLIQGDEIQEAERAFKGLGIKDAGEEGGGEDCREGGNAWKGKEKVGKEVMKIDILDILADPLYSLKFMGTPLPSTSDFSSTHDGTSPASGSGSVKRSRSVRSERRRDRFVKVLEGKERNGYGGRYGGVVGGAGAGAGAAAAAAAGTARAGGVDAAELRKLAWSGIPSELRPIAWQMLLNYLPLPSQPRLTTLHRKRREYAQLVDQAFGRGLSSMEANIWHQIEIDVPRTRPGVALWSCEATQRSLERILYVWAIRHPASGYVQGINDLVTPFFEVFLGAYIDCDPELFDVSHLPEQVLAAIEADSFWCLSKLLDGIQDNYTFAQPGIQRLVRRMGELVRRIDAPLATHLEEQGVEFMQFAFRWMNCLLMREISVKCTIRMWDTYLSEGTDAFSQFHLYVCSAFLVKWSEKLREMDFQEIIMFLQCLPTQSWTDHDVELLLSEAFVLKSVWQGAENHFMGLPVAPLGGGMGGRQ